MMNAVMKKRITLLASLVLLFGTAQSVFAGDAIEPGTKAPEFNLKDINGKEHALTDFLDSKYAVLMFIATQCPVSNAYNQRMVKLFDDYAPKEVAFVGINSNKQEGVSEMKEHAAKHGFKFTILKDERNVVADSYGAQVTPEVFVVDPAGVVRYHGRIDDSKDASEVESHDLRAALISLLEGEEPARKATKAFGCTIKRVKKES